MLDLIGDFGRMDQDWVGAFRPSKIPTHGNLPDGETHLSIKQSRLNFDGFIPTRVGEIHGRFEFDLYGVGDDAGQTTMRVRHVYGELKRLLAGQTNTVFMDIDVFPNVIDYWGPNGEIFIRNPQLRYTPIRRDGKSVAISIEQPGSAVDAGNVEENFPELNVQGRNKYPDLVAHYREEGSQGHYQIAGILRNLAFEDRDSPDGEPSDEKVGGGFSASVVTKVFKRDKIYAQATYGWGISSYFNDGGIDLAPDESKRATTVSSLGYQLYYEHPWSSKWTSSIGYSEHVQDNEAGQLGDAYHRGKYFSVNLLYSPVRYLLMGIEFLWGEREDKDGSTGDDSRVQVSFKYNFSNQ
jgi:hypothetical protein